MDAIVERQSALDVHKAQVTACVRVPGAAGERAQHVEQFKTKSRAVEEGFDGGQRLIGRQPPRPPVDLGVSATRPAALRVTAGIAGRVT
jgi:hypothetical protein